MTTQSVPAADLLDALKRADVSPDAFLYALAKSLARTRGGQLLWRDAVRAASKP